MCPAQVAKFNFASPFANSAAGILDLERKVFAERLPDFVEPFARTTVRFCQQITSIGLATCGKGGVRLAARLGIRTTRQTILRCIMDLPDFPAASILFLGIDDFAFLRGRRFGTILVNLETRRVADLLPDRKAETSAAWMRHHPDLMRVGSRSWRRLCSRCQGCRSTGDSVCRQIPCDQKFGRGARRACWRVILLLIGAT
jgi:hypothetical protein